MVLLMPILQQRQTVDGLTQAGRTLAVTLHEATV